MNQGLLSKILLPFHHLFLPIKAHPLLAGTFALIGGITYGAAYLNATAACISLIALLVATQKDRKLIALVFVFFCLGFILYSYQENHYNSLYLLAQDKTASLQGTIINITPIENPRFNKIITVKINQLWINKKDIFLSFCPLVQLYANNTLSPHMSDTIRLENIHIKKPSNQEFGRYLCKEGVHATIFLDKSNKTYIIATPDFSWQRIIYNMRAGIHATLEQKMSPRTFCFFNSLFLGNKQSNKLESDQHKEHFTSWGVSHHFSRSGFHLLIFIFVLQLFFCPMPIGFIKKQFLVVLLCTLYALLSWSSLGFLRALAMFFAYKICICAQELTTALHCLTIICICMLLLNPMQLFFLGFQLNFALTFGLAWFSQLQTQRKRPFL